MLITKPDKRFLLKNLNFGEGNFLKFGAFPKLSKNPWKDRDLEIWVTGANIEYLLEHWPDAIWSDEAKPDLEDFHKQRVINAKGKEEKALDLSKFANDGYIYNPNTPPYDHQRKAFLLSRERESYALLMEQGTGKTKVIIDTAAYLYKAGKIDTLAVIAPNGVHENWIINEFPAHAPEWLDYYPAVYYSGATKKQHAEISTAIHTTHLRVIAFNVESFSARNGKSSKSQELLDMLLKHDRVLLVVDESSRIKTPSAKRTKYLSKVSKGAAFTRIMSGTPVTKGLEDLYSQFLFLDPMILGFDTFTTFKARFCIERKLESGGQMIVGYKNQEDLIDKIGGYSFRVTKQDCLDLPEKIYKRFPVHLSPKQKKLYNDLLTEWQAQMDSETMTAQLAIVRLIRLQQILSGWFKPDPEEKALQAIEKVNPRMQALKTILEDCQGKVVIWARFIADLDLIEKELGKDCIRYRGDIALANEFQNSETLKYFVGNPQSGGTGITLTAAETVIYYSNSFNLEERMQSEDRTHRIGTTGNVTYIDLQTEGTVDTKIVSALRNKHLIAEAIMEDPHQFFMEYAE